MDAENICIRATLKACKVQQYWQGRLPAKWLMSSCTRPTNKTQAYDRWAHDTQAYDRWAHDTQAYDRQAYDMGSWNRLMIDRLMPAAGSPVTQTQLSEFRADCCTLYVQAWSVTMLNNSSLCSRDAGHVRNGSSKATGCLPHILEGRGEEGVVVMQRSAIKADKSYHSCGSNMTCKKIESARHKQNIYSTGTEYILDQHSDNRNQGAMGSNSQD